MSKTDWKYEYFWDPTEFQRTKTLEPTGKGLKLVDQMAVDLNLKKNKVILANGKNIEYKKLLLCTGTKLDLPDYPFSDRVIPFYGIQTHKKIMQKIKSCKSVAVVGGGLLGSEVATMLSKEAKVTLYDDKVMQSILPEHLSEWATDRVREMGIEVKEYKDLNEINDDLCVVCPKSSPNDVLARRAGLEIAPQGGVLVTSNLMAMPNVYVAGDIASYYDFDLGQRRRTPSYENAMKQGEIAGENMAGNSRIYEYEPSFETKINNSFIEGTGIVDSNLETITFQNDKDRNSGDFKAVCFYVKDTIVGVTTINMKNTEQSKKIVKAQLPRTDARDLAKMFSLY